MAITDSAAILLCFHMDLFPPPYAEEDSNYKFPSV